jgi:tRNA(Ile)-lysidine synthase
VLATIRKRGLLARGERVVVACSGGPDSVALTHVLHRVRDALGVELRVASVDHGLRSESAAEVARVGEFAASLGLPFDALTVTVAAGDSLQAKAREARYAALHAVAKAHGATKIAVGHTRDDQAETVLDRMMRGSGLRGLAGIDPCRKDGVVRPLIDVERAEIERYVAHHGLAVTRDPSNEAERFRRARIRKTLMPMLAAESSAVIAHLADLADEARETIADLDARVPHLLGDIIPLESLRGLPGPILRATLRNLAFEATSEPPNRAHIEALRDLLEKGTEVWLKGGVRVLRTEQSLVIDRSLQHPGRVVRRTKNTAPSQIPQTDDSEGSQD